MTTDFRALCARLADELDYYRQLLMDDRRETHALASEARAALAEPQPEPPTECEVAELTAWLLDGGEDAAANGWDYQARQFGRAAELLLHLQSQPKPPTNDC